MNKRKDKMIEALLRIAFDPEVNDLTGDPTKWSSTIAYKALGGKIEHGVRLNDKDELLAKLKEGK